MPYFGARQRKLRLTYYIVLLISILIFIFFCYSCWDRIIGSIALGVVQNRYILTVDFFDYNKVLGIIGVILFIWIILFDTIIKNYLEDYHIETLTRHFVVFYYIFIITCFSIVGFVFYAFSLKYYYSSTTIPNFLSVTTLFIMLIWMIYEFKKFYSNKVYGDNNISISGYILARLPKKPSEQDNFSDISSDPSLGQARVIPIQTSQTPTLPLSISNMNNNEDDSIEFVDNIEQEYAIEDTKAQREDVPAEIQNLPNIITNESKDAGDKKIIIPQKDGKNLVFSSKEIRLIKILAQTRLMEINTAAFILSKDD